MTHYQVMGSNRKVNLKSLILMLLKEELMVQGIKTLRQLEYHLDNKNKPEKQHKDKQKNLIEYEIL